MTVRQNSYSPYAPLDDKFFTEKHPKQIEQVKEKFGVNKDHRIISYFGRLFPEKGISDLILAFDNVKKQFPNTTLVLGGYGFLVK